MALRTFFQTVTSWSLNTVTTPSLARHTPRLPIQPHPETTDGSGHDMMTGDYIGVNYTTISPLPETAGSLSIGLGTAFHTGTGRIWRSTSWVRKARRPGLPSQPHFDNMYMNIKFRNKTYQDKELRIRQNNDPTIPIWLISTYFDRVEHSENTIRLSLDYRF